MGSMRQCAIMHLTNLCCSLRGAPANPNGALRNAGSLPSCLEVNFCYKFFKRDEAAEGIFGDERPPSPGAGSAHDSTALCFCDDKASRDTAKNIHETDLALLRARTSVPSGNKAIKSFGSIKYQSRSQHIRHHVWSIRLCRC